MTFAFDFPNILFGVILGATFVSVLVAAVTVIYDRMREE